MLTLRTETDVSLDTRYSNVRVVLVKTSAVVIVGECQRGRPGCAIWHSLITAFYSISGKYYICSNVHVPMYAYQLTVICTAHGERRLISIRCQGRARAVQF